MSGYLIREFSWGDITGIPGIWNESQIPELDAAKITTGEILSTVIPKTFDANSLNLKPSDDANCIFRFWPNPETNTDDLRAELSFNLNNGQFQFKFNTSTNPSVQFIQADYDGSWVRFSDDFEETQFNSDYSVFSSTEKPTDSSTGAVRIPGIGMGDGVIFANDFINAPCLKLSTPETLPAGDGSIYYDNANHDILAIVNGVTKSLISNAVSVSWNDLTDIPTVLADGEINYTELINIPAEWNESQIPSLAIAKIIGLQTELNNIQTELNNLLADLNNKLDGSYVPDWQDIDNVPTTWSEPQIPNLPISKTTGLQSALDGKLENTYQPTWGSITGVPLAWSETQIPDLAISKITNLQTELNSKLNNTYSPVWSNLPSINNTEFTNSATQTFTASPAIALTSSVPQILFHEIDDNKRWWWHANGTGFYLLTNDESGSTNWIGTSPIYIDAPTQSFEVWGAEVLKVDSSPSLPGSFTFTNNVAPIVCTGISPRILLHDTDDNIRYWLLNTVDNLYITRGELGDASWSTPHPLRLGKTSEVAQVWGHDVWHSGNFPITEGNFTPYPQGTGWGYTSQGTWSKKGDWVFVSDVLINITSVGTNGDFRISGFPFSATGFSFINARVKALTGMPSDGYSQCGFMTGSTFRPQYVTGTNGSLVNYSIDKITVGTEIRLTGLYQV